MFSEARVIYGLGVARGIKLKLGISVIIIIITLEFSFLSYIHGQSKFKSKLILIAEE